LICAFCVSCVSPAVFDENDAEKEQNESIIEEAFRPISNNNNNNEASNNKKRIIIIIITKKENAHWITIQ
jgi:hypothetical protein